MQLKLAFIIFILLAFSCSQEVVNYKGEIEYDQGKTYYTNQFIFLSVNGDDLDYNWESNIDGNIGVGKDISVKLEVGIHSISLSYDNRVLDSIELEVLEPQYTPGSSIDLTVYNNTIYLPKGTFSPTLISLSESSANVTSNFQSNNLQENRNIKENSYFNKKLYKLKPQTLNSSSLSSSRNLDNNFKEFVVADTTGVNIDGIKVNAKLLKSSNNAELWVDINSDLNAEVYNDLWEDLSTIAIPRTITLWGEWADVDNDDRVKILVTPEINKQNKAVGFFNSNDLYYPTVMDIVYIGDPTYDITKFAYSKNSLLATVAHELTHLIIHSNKVYFPKQNGVEDPKREEVFLDEGLAHLTESLCGYGVSGGNIAFLSKFLESPESYSLRFKNVIGLEDSVGRRGFVSAFLSWLFWYYGGAEWSSNDSGKITDNGGISFLRKLLYSTNTGWDNLNYATDNCADRLFKMWGEEISNYDNNQELIPDFKIDPVTSEFLEISPFLGDITINEKVYNLKGPARNSISGRLNLLPYSIMFGNEIKIEESNNYSVVADNEEGLIFFKCMYLR